MRIQKVLSDNGITSRRAAEKLISEKRITVNGRTATAGQNINSARDIIHIDNERVYLQKKIAKYYIALNKPRGYVTTLADELDRRCVADLVKDVDARVYPIGRLDKDSEGLLLLTNDGDFANLIMHPRNHISKTYRVTIRPKISEDQLISLSAGVKLDDGYVTAPAQVQVETVEEGRTVIRITIREGKNRQIRRMCDAVGATIIRLRRVSVGPIKLGMLKPGTWRDLTTVEVAAVRNAITTTPLPSKKTPGQRRLDKMRNYR